MQQSPVLILKNVSHESPGLIQTLLEEKELDFELIDLSKTIDLPDITKYCLLVLMGGPDSANDTSPKILKELQVVKDALKSSIPILGICLGLQLLVKAIGGKITPNPVPEIGFKMEDDWNHVKLTALGRKDPIFKGIDKELIAFHLHGETVEITDAIRHLGYGEYCKYQVVKYRKNNYGFQFHIELTRPMLLEWFKEAPELKDADESLMLSHFNQVEEPYQVQGTTMILNFLKITKLY